MMKYSVLIVTFLCLPVFGTAAATTLFRWVDDDGKVHYSDSVPPSKAQKGHTEMDKLGNKVRKVSAAKSSDQVAEEEWLGELEGKLKLKKEQQQRKDSQLLSTYDDIEQLDEVYAERLHVMLEEREQLELFRDRLEKELERLVRQHKDSEDESTKKRVQGFIDTNKENTKAYREAIEQNITEEKTTRFEARKLRKRFLYLKERKALVDASES